MRSSSLIIFLVLFLLSANTAWSQYIELKGQITDQSGHEPLAGATVALYKQNDSSLVSGTVSDSAGYFVIKSRPGVKYFLEISFIGFISDTIPDLFPTKSLFFGVIALKPSEILLDEISITSEKSIMTNRLDKKVYHVGKDVMAESSSAREILQNIPSVTVDINGGITLRNSSNITFFLNGKPSALLRKNPSVVLEQIPAGSIDRIEIITNPSAKYRPDGIGGIINIVLKKEKKQGLNGQISAHGGNEGRYNTDLNINYGTENLKFFGNYGLRHSNGTVLYTDDRVYKDSLHQNILSYYDENGHSKTNALSHNIYAGMSYDINDFNSAGFSGSYFQQNSLHNGESEIESLDSIKNPDYHIKNVQTNNEYEKEGELNFTYEHNFKNKKDHGLTLEATYSGYDEKENKIFNQIYTVPNNITDISHYLIRKSGCQQEVMVDYVLPMGKNAEFNSGYAGEFIVDNIKYNYNVKKSQFIFHQQIHAAYVLYGQSIGNFSFKAGLRAEQANIRSHLITPADSLTPNNYFKLYPTIHLGYDISDKNQLSLSYSKRVNRPDADGLNPNPEFSDPRNAEAGNPNLKPEQTHSLELGFSNNNDNFSITSSLYYRYKYDAFTSIFKNIADSIILSTTTNLHTRQSGGLEGVLSGSLFHHCNYSLTTDIFYTTIDASNLGYTKNKSSVSGNIKGYTLLKFSKKTFVQINAYYYFPSITPQGKRNAFYYLNIGLRQNLFKNRASLTLTGTDVFHTYKIIYKIESAGLNQFTTIQRKLPVFYIGFIWRLNNFKDKNKIDFEGEGLVK